MGTILRNKCYKLLKSEALKNTISGEWIKYRLNHKTKKHEIDSNREVNRDAVL